MLSKELSSTIFWVFGMIWPGPIANTLPTRPIWPRRLVFNPRFSHSKDSKKKKKKKKYLIPLSIIRNALRVKWSNPGKGVAPSPTPRCSSYWKRSLQVTNFILIALPRLKNPVSPTIYSYWREKRWIYVFPWTQINNSISYDNNHYIKHTSIKWLYRVPCWTFHSISWDIGFPWCYLSHPLVTGCTELHGTSNQD